jgi:hypothetical protein
MRVHVDDNYMFPSLCRFKQGAWIYWGHAYLFALVSVEV